MKVLFQSRKTLFSVPGGDTIQLIKTKEHLEKIGLKVDISTDLEPDLGQYDLVHVFNLMRAQESFLQVSNAKKQEKKIALSTIYGLYTDYDRTARGLVGRSVARAFSPYAIETLKIMARGIKGQELHKGVCNVFIKGYYSTLQDLLGMVNVFLPNSESEMRRVIKEFALKDPRYVVVPNAVDAAIFDPKVVDSSEIKEYEGCVLCVARIEGRKSQLNLVKAMRGLPYKLVLIGSPAPNHRGYFKRMMKEAGDNVVWLGQVGHDQLPKFYKAAKVHALVSWMETPGLSSLEAAAMGCNIVVTKKGDTYDYFGDHAFYCKPDDIDTIRKAVVSAYEAPQDEVLVNKVISNYNWTKTAEMTVEGYELALKGT